MNYPTIFPELSTERLVLRQLSLNDRRAIFKLHSNKEVNQIITREGPKNLNDSDAFIQTCSDKFEKEESVLWALQLIDSDQIIGTIAFQNIDAENSYAEISYELNPDFQNEGFMNEAMTPVLDFGKNTISLKTIEAFTHEDNNPSIALLGKHQFILQEDELFNGNQLYLFDINQE